MKSRFVPVLLGLVLAQSSWASAPAPPSAPVRWYEDAKSWVTGLWSKDAGDWLARIGPALTRLNYQGTLVMVSGMHVETLGIFHAYDGGRERLRLVTLTGAHREVVRDGTRVISIGADVGPVGYDADATGQWNPAEQFADAASLDGYRAKLGDTARVADRDAQVVEIQAKDRWRYGHRLWLDKQTALPLRLALMNERGQPLEQMMFTQLRLGDVPDAADLKPSAARDGKRVRPPAPVAETDPGWRVVSPPPGFTLRGARRLGDSVQLLYSDGLASVSVYVEPMLPGGQRGDSLMQRGAVNARSIWGNGRRVVAIGKVPAQTVDLFARNAQPVPAEKPRG